MSGEARAVVVPAPASARDAEALMVDTMLLEVSVRDEHGRRVEPLSWPVAVRAAPSGHWHVHGRGCSGAITSPLSFIGAAANSPPA